MRGAITLFVVAMATSTLAAQETRGGAAEAAAAKVIAQYNQGLNSGDLNMVMGSFLPDGKWMPPNQPMASGEAALRQWYINYWKNTIAKLEFTPTLVRISGRMAYVEVHVTGTTTPKAGGAPRQQDNKGVFVLLQGNDGTWKTASYVLNSSKPVPTPVSTPAR